MQQKASVGGIVHYYPPYETEPVAAIITRVHSDSLVDLTVFWPMAEYRNHCVAMVHEGARWPQDARGGWCWPPGT